MQLPRLRPWEILIALAGAAALVGDALYRGSGSVALAIPLALIACLPLAWSSQKPLPALLATTVGLVVCLAAFQPYHTAIFVLAAALYNVASLGDRRRSLIVGAGARSASKRSAAASPMSGCGSRATSTTRSRTRSSRSTSAPESPHIYTEATKP